MHTRSVHIQFTDILELDPDSRILSYHITGREVVGFVIYGGCIMCVRVATAFFLLLPDAMLSNGWKLVILNTYTYMISTMNVLYTIYI